MVECGAMKRSGFRSIASTSKADRESVGSPMPKTKITKFRADRHTPQLKGTASKTKPAPNPLVTLLQGAIQGSRSMSGLNDGDQSNFAAKILGDLLIGGDNLANTTISNLGSAGKDIDFSSLGAQNKRRAVKTMIDGPIRAKLPTEKSEVLYLDEVTIIKPRDFALEHGIEVDLSNGVGVVAKKVAMEAEVGPESGTSISSGVDSGAMKEPVKMRKVRPISANDFEAECARLGVEEASGVVATVSGGPDSMAMALLLANYCVKKQLPLLCVTIDHAMRPEAPAEALVTQNWLHAQGIPHTIVRLEWPNREVPTHGVQSKARDARYDAVTKIANEFRDRISQVKKHGLQRGRPPLSSSNEGEDPKIHIMMAHNAEDNVETFWLRMAGSSGIYGLAGIAETRVISEGICITRPLLTFSKLRLYATLIAADHPWASDPSNAKLLYKRNQVRHTLDSIYAGSSIAPDSKKNTNEELAPSDSPSLTQSTSTKSTSASSKSTSASDSNITTFSASSYAVTAADASAISQETSSDSIVTLEEMQQLQLNFTKARFMLDTITHNFCRDYISVSSKYGYVVIPTQSMLSVPDVFVLRILDTVLAHVSGNSTPMRLKATKALLQKIKAAREELDRFATADSRSDPSSSDEPISATQDGFAESKRRGRTIRQKSEAVALRKMLERTFCLHRCIVIQSPGRIIVAMQNAPNAPAAALGGKEPLPPYRADFPIPLGTGKAVHWLNSWKISYEPNEIGLAPESKEELAKLPPQLYVRQIQERDLPILRELGTPYLSWSLRLSKHVILSLPVIVDEHSQLVCCSFISPPYNFLSNFDAPGVAPRDFRLAVRRLSKITVVSAPEHHLANPPASSFIGYSSF